MTRHLSGNQSCSSSFEQKTADGGMEKVGVVRVGLTPSLAEPVKTAAKVDEAAAEKQLDREHPITTYSDFLGDAFNGRR